jgi:hypothetical protein
MTTAAASTAPASTRGNRRAAINGFRFSMAAAMAWIVLGVDSVVRPIQDNRRDTFWMLPFVLTTVTFVYLHQVQSSRSKLERFSYYLVMVASVLAFVGNIGIQTGSRSLSALGFPGGAILWAVGLILFGIGTFKAKVLPVLRRKCTDSSRTAFDSDGIGFIADSPSS